MDNALPPEIAAAFAPVLGCPAWQVKKGHGSFLTLEFGAPRLEVGPVRKSRKPGCPGHRDVAVTGDWHLWIYCCGWNIVQDSERMAHSESADAAIAKATGWLDGQLLERLWMEPGTTVTRFEFDLGGVLETFPVGDDPSDEQWFLYEPSGDVLGVRADGRFSYGPGDTPPDEVRWLPLCFGQGGSGAPPR